MLLGHLRVFIALKCLCVSFCLNRLLFCGILAMLRSIRHKGLEKFFKTGKASGIQAKHAKKLRAQLAILDTAESITDVDRPGFNLHSLKGKSKDRWSITVNDNWRLTFEFKNGDVFVLDYEDYH